MDEIINSDEKDAQIAALNHEIFELTKKLESEKKRYISAVTSDKSDPFGNPTDYKEFSGDYSKILPELGTPGFSVPLMPEYAERRALQKNYSIGGWCSIFQFFLTNGIGILMVWVITFAMRLLNPDASSADINDYISSSSILTAVNMLVYMFCNILNASIGLKWGGIKASSLVRTKKLSFGSVFQYCAIGLFIWIVAIYLSSGIIDVFRQYGIDASPSGRDYGTTVMGRTVTVIYGCIIAPITEELFYRGMMLRVLSKANQRFAVFATAMYFGIAHGNVAQFVLGFLAGIFLAHITLKHGSIIPAVIVHMFINTFSTVYGSVNTNNSNTMMMATLILLAIAILGLAIFIAFMCRDELPNPTPAQSRRGFYLWAGSIPVMISVILYVGYFCYHLFL